MKHTLKKSLAIILAAATILCCAPLSGIADIDLPDFGGFQKLADSVSDFFDGFATKAEAETVYTNGLYTYVVYESRYSVITDVYFSISGNITIPSTLGGYPVTLIGDSAFDLCDGLTGITIPDSVTSIGRHAFSFCYNLTSIKISDSVTSIGDGAFYNCNSLTNVTIPDSVTSIGDGAFGNCHSLTSITIPNGVTSIGSETFYGCNGLTSIIIPDSVTSIGSNAFYLCNSLTSITIPDSVTYIGEYAFYGCNSLTSVTISYSVTCIQKYAFASCGSLADVYYTGTEEEWKNISIYNAGNDYLLYATIHYNYMIQNINKIEECKVGDIIEFGWYPQSKVMDSGIVSELNSLAGDNKSWVSYGYYNGTGGWNDGQMKPGDYMRFKDVMYGSNKYRGVVFDTYRPYYTGYETISSTSSSYQARNGYFIGTVYWFKYEPVKWRVLDPATGMVMTETILDSQAYNNFILFDGTDEYGEGAYWGDSSKTYYANNYAKSSIREWLNKDFYNTAFSTAQQGIIEYTALDNTAYDDYYWVYDSETTYDKIYLLSWGDALNMDYGFSSNVRSDITREAQGSDYVKCQGLDEKNYNWQLRSAGDLSDYTCVVGRAGNVVEGGLTHYTPRGIRPALNFNLNSEIFQSDVSELNSCENTDAYCSIESVKISSVLPVILGNTLTFTVTTSTDITKLRMEDGKYIVNEWEGSEYYTDNGDVRIWTVTQIINTIGENRYLDFRAGNADGYEEGTYQSPVFTCIENEHKLPATTIEHPLSSGAFVQGDEQNLIWTVDGVPGDGVVPDYFIINVFKDNKLVFAERNLTAVEYLGDDGKFFYNIDGAYFKEAGEYEISVTAVKEGWQFSEDKVVITIYSPDLYIEGFNSEIEMVNAGESYYFSGKIIGANENISVVIQTPSESLSHEYFSQTKVVQEFDLSTLYPITFGSGEYSEPGEYYIKIFARSVGKGEETLLAQKRVVLLEEGVEQLDKPVITSSVVTKSGESYKITWDAVENADYYTVIVSELGIRKTGIENEYFELTEKTFKSAGEYTIIVYAHSFSDEYVTSNNSIKLTVTRQDIGCSVLSAKIIGETTIKAGYALKFEVVTTQNATKLKMMDKNYVVTEWTDSSNYVDKDGKRYWNVTELMKTVGVNRKLQFYAGNSQGYSDISAEVTFTCNENPNKLGNITITSPVDGYSYDQNNLQYLVWNYDSEILPDYYIVEVFTNSQTKKYLNKNVDGNLLWIEIPAEYFENTGTFTISIIAVKEFYQTSSARVTFISKCTHMHTQTSTEIVKNSYKELDETQHTYQKKTVETCTNCPATVKSEVKTIYEEHTMYEGLLCVCGYYKIKMIENGLHLQSNKNERTYLDASTRFELGYVSPSDSGDITMYGKVNRNGVEYAFIRYPLNSGGYKCGFVRSELIGKYPFGQKTASINGTNVNIVCDANGYVYADAEQLFDVLGGSSNTKSLNMSGWVFKASVGFFHNSYEHSGTEIGFTDSKFNSATSIKWISSGDKKVIENGKYYDIEYYLYGKIQNKRVLGGNQKLYTANNRIYFPLSVLTSDICMYDETSTNVFVYRGFNSNSLRVNTPQLTVKDVIVMHSRSNNEMIVEYAPTEGVTTKLGTDLLCEVSGISAAISYNDTSNKITVFPNDDGFGIISIYIKVNGVKTVIWQKTLHSIDKQYINLTQSDYEGNLLKNMYNLAPGLIVTDIKIKEKTNGHNVSFNAYNNELGSYLFQVHDANGNVCDFINESNKQVGFAFAEGHIKDGGVLAGVKYGFEEMWVNISWNKTKARLEDSDEFTKTQISLWVPIGGYITIKDAESSKAALTYDVLTLYGLKGSVFMDYINGILGLSKNVSEDILSKNIRPIDFLNNFIVETELKTIADKFVDFITTGDKDIYEIYLKNLIKNAFDELIEVASEAVSECIAIIDTVSTLGVSWCNVKLLATSITEDLEDFKSVDKEFGLTTLYFGGHENPNLSRFMLLKNSPKDNTAVEPKNEIITNGYYSKLHNGKYGLSDINGNFVISPEWDCVGKCACGIVPVVDDTGVKFLDITGRILFETNYISAESFSYDVCVVMDDMLKTGVIDIYGNQVVPCKYEYAWILYDGYILVQTNNDYQIINPCGEFVCSLKNRIVHVSDDNKVLIVADENGSIGAVSYNGQKITGCKFSSIGGINGNAIAMKKDGVYIVYDLNGEKLFEIAADYIGEFSEGVATVTDETEIRLVDLSGNTVAEMPDDVSDVYPFKDNYAVVYYADGSFAYMNKQYQIVSEKYSFASDFNDGYAIVSSNEDGVEKWKMIDEQFNTVYVFEGQIEFSQKDFESGYVFNSSETGESGYITLGDKKTQKSLISLEKTQTTLRVEDVLTMKVVSKNNDSALMWKSSEPAVATVDANGNVTAISVGETVITVSDGDNNSSSCVVIVLSNKFKVVWNVEGNKTEQTVKIGEEIVKPETPVKSGYKFVGWTPEIPDIMPDYDLIFTAVFEKSYICPECGNEIVGEDAINEHIASETKVTINGGTVTSGVLTPGATIKVEADQIDGKVFSHWTVEGATVEDANKAETTFVLGSGKISITAEYDDCECKCHQGGIVGFFFKIVLFFQKLFGNNLECFCGTKH